jgi:hypothetical protein
MTREDYEYRYGEALDIVRERMPGDLVGEPMISITGQRLVQISGKPHTDEMVFTLAWSRETARDIVGQYRVIAPRR